MPNTKDKLIAVKKAIQEAVPEILKLKFGCYFASNRGQGASKNPKQLYIGSGQYINNVGLIEEVARKDVFDENFKILGRPITLEDVLRVLQNSVIPMGDYSLDDGYFNIYKIESDEPEIEWSWLLGEPLDKQSKETINLLYELLNK